MRKFYLIYLFLIAAVSLQVQAQDKQFELTDFVYGKFRAKSVHGLRSMNDGAHYTTFEDNKVTKYSYATGKKVAIIADANALKIDGVTGYTFSADESKILFTANKKSIYRRSFTANFYVWNSADNSVKPVSDKQKQELATLTQDGSMVGFVQDNNIYIRNLASGKEKAVTTDGQFNKIINGKPDWVYEEEFEFNKAFAWSPDGKKLAFIKFDESKVKEFSMSMFAGKAPMLKDNVLYPETRTWKYPKAGDNNSVVSVHIYELETGKTTQVDVGEETDQYLPRIKWSNTNELIVYRLNRLQNKLELLLSDALGNTKLVYTDQNKYYIEEKDFDYLTFLPDNKSFIVVSERDGYNHLYICGLYDASVKQITKGNWDVTDYLGYNTAKKTVFFQAAGIHPTQREVYSIKINGKSKTQLSTKVGTNSANFSKSFKYYINSFSNAATPTIVTLHDAKGKKIRTLLDNKKLNDKLAEYTIGKKEFFSFKTSQGVELNGYMLKPANFDASEKYPVWMYQYSGPNSQTATDRWGMGWEYLMAQDGIITVVVDGRGTGARGEAFRKVTYKELGKLETIDQIETAKHLGSLDFVDAERIGIWGWSYGGFMTLNAMTKGADYFKAGIAVAPVTNWRYYDNIYTERFMRTPQENPTGYDNNSPINHADKLKGKLLLIHGSADDNVHVQNSMEMAEALVQAGKQFDYFIYTNRNHGIYDYSGKTRMHLYTKMYNFIKDNL